MTKHEGVGSRALLVLVTVAAGVGLGVVVALMPALVGILLATALFVAVYFVAPRASLPFIVLGLLLLIPLDHVGPFREDYLGMPIFAIATLGALLSLLSPRRPLQKLATSSWDVGVLALSIVIVASVNGLTGGIRQAGMLVAGVLFYLWIRAASAPEENTARWLLQTVFFVGAIQGLLTIAERTLGARQFAALVPLYEPAFKEFTLTLGSRATALAGHPLRLGAIEMTALIAGVALSRDTRGPQLAVRVVLIVLCAVGLVSSGARGAWLGAVIGVIAMLAVTPGKQSHRFAIRLSIGGALAWVALEFLDLFPLVYESLFGTAVRPASVGQRVGVLGATLAIWLQRPLLGYGFGTYLQEVFAQGFRFSNTENEYVNFLLAGGLLGFLAFGLVLARALIMSWRFRRVPVAPALFGLLAAWAFDIGTFNTFSWSAAFPLFMAVVAVTHDVAPQ